MFDNIPVVLVYEVVVYLLVYKGLPTCSRYWFQNTVYYRWDCIRFMQNQVHGA